MRYYLSVALACIVVACAFPPTPIETAAQLKTIELILLQSDCEHRGGYKVKGKCFPPLPPSAGAASAARAP